jgi:hypothetical protein
MTGSRLRPNTDGQIIQLMNNAAEMQTVKPDTGSKEVPPTVGGHYSIMRSAAS